MPCPVWESNDANGKLLGREEGAESDWTSGSRLGRGPGGGAKGTIFEVIIATAAMRVEGGDIHNILGVRVSGERG